MLHYVATQFLRGPTNHTIQLISLHWKNVAKRPHPHRVTRPTQNVLPVGVHQRNPPAEPGEVRSLTQENQRLTRSLQELEVPVATNGTKGHCYVLGAIGRYERGAPGLTTRNKDATSSKDAIRWRNWRYHRPGPLSKRRPTRSPNWRVDLGVICWRVDWDPRLPFRNIPKKQACKEA